ncbi:NAD(P)-dependent alcohol dehydrogenase [Polynucleobacter sp. JS-Safj-400b-B2]|uniref:NAD(P)-dependent alcohol dehydrogenase n=1 Tax=Polynucleobacter sp. JS-Safj-400b-B2 TaxID=2576921 RepID=UPI001C0D3FC8|nr:NAD(P)-dependent alcohol dehydrogenase [Polynucleobacter sp. JS-Safj-400b-B2]MBU3626974.1 NAD(P)-dependent alcohol dehydrogenase [Polynucleobacter sp. JS-Safj-400b-B2]
MSTTSCYAAQSDQSLLEPFKIERRKIGANDVQIAIEFCGVCHSDIHVVKNEWGGSHYPVVPGHEIIGKVTALGGDVSHLKIGQRVGVGYMGGSCQVCTSCKSGLEQYCLEGFSPIFNAPSKDVGGFTYGGYSKSIVVDKHFVLIFPMGLDPAGAAPLLCAGITTYSPLKHWGVKPGMTVGIIGLGGLGHMGVKLSHAMGAKTIMITSSKSKAADAIKLGADEVLISTDPVAMQNMNNQFDFLLNTIPGPHDYNHYMNLLKVDGNMCIVGSIGPTAELNTEAMVYGRRSIAGSLVGGIKETQEMLYFCAKHQIVSEIEMIKMDQINVAYERILKNDVKYRFVIDMSSLH